jgi:hypothetical protein
LQQAAAAATLVQGPLSSSSRRAERNSRGAWRRTDGTNGKAHSGIQWTKVHQRFKADHDTYASWSFCFKFLKKQEKSIKVHPESIHLRIGNTRY